LNPHVLADTGT